MLLCNLNADQNLRRSFASWKSQKLLKFLFYLLNINFIRSIQMLTYKFKGKAQLYLEQCLVQALWCLEGHRKFTVRRETTLDSDVPFLSLRHRRIPSPANKLPVPPCWVQFNGRSIKPQLLHTKQAHCQVVGVREQICNPPSILTLILGNVQTPSWTSGLLQSAVGFIWWNIKDQVKGRGGRCLVSSFIPFPCHFPACFWNSECLMRNVDKK